MEVIKVKKFSEIKVNNLVLALGFFDGFHLAHQKIFSKVMEIKDKANKKAGILTFSQSIKKDSSFLTSSLDKQKLANEIGFDYYIEVELSKEIIETKAETFIELVLKQQKALICGFDYTFGYNREGKVNDLLKLDISVFVIGEVLFEEEKIGTSLIKDFLSVGRIKDANYLLTRNYQISGTVVHGKGLGRKLGYKTANILNQGYYLPKEGVYVTKIIVEGNSYLSMTSIGCNPTFSEEKQTIECHIPGFDKDIYGKEARIEFIERIRDMIKFSNSLDLKKQLDSDLNFTLKYQE